MGECAFESHNWASEKAEHGDYQLLVLRCRRCGVGHSVSFKNVPPGKIRVDLRVFVADGDDVGIVSPGVLAWSFASYETTVSRIEADGIDVIRGTPEIGDRF